uniref:Uncharacterized protein n=1 Tax=Vespula pensylvanica TaxID=30213 RepID=A0A834PF95_VESPE|nr:hypothetical protein H0235_001003 [Vespula pensylvanica]
MMPGGHVDDRVRSPNTLRCVTATTSLSISPLSPEEPVTLPKSHSDKLVARILRQERAEWKQYVTVAEVEEEKLGGEGKTGVGSSCRGGSVAATGAAHLTLMLTPRSFLYPSQSAS